VVIARDGKYLKRKRIENQEDIEKNRSAVTYHRNYRDVVPAAGHSTKP
jgi:hypothetical protein